MITLIILGFAVVVTLALFVTVAAIGCVFGEVWFSESLSPFSWLLVMVSAALWYAAIKLAPFSISFGVTT